VEKSTSQINPDTRAGDGIPSKLKAFIEAASNRTLDEIPLLSKDRIRELNEASEKPFAIKRAYFERCGYTSLDESLWRHTFDGLQVLDQNRAAVERVKKWNPGEHKKGLVLWGSVGTGKTILTYCIINQFATKEFRCKFVKVSAAMDSIQESFNTKTYGFVKESLNEPKLLILDELTEKTTDWRADQILSIFDERSNTGRHTIFTTNLNPEELKTVYGARIKDRMVEFCSWVQVEGDLSFRVRDFENEV